MKRLFFAIALVLLSASSAFAQGGFECVTFNGVTTCSQPTQFHDSIARTVSQAILDLTQTWNNTSVTFTGVKLNITDTNSASGSLLIDLQKNSTSQFSVDKSGNVTSVGNYTPSGVVKLSDGSAAAPSLTFTNNINRGLYNDTSGSGVGISVGGSGQFEVFGGGIVTLNSGTISISSTGLPSGADVVLARDAANTLALRNGSNAQTLRIGPSASYIDIANANQVTAPTDSTTVAFGSVTRFRSSSTITPASGGAGNCGTAFAAAALTADCTIATIPAGQKLVAFYADVTTGVTCSATCSGTKTISVGKTAGGTEILASGLSVATTNTQFGLADADMGSQMTRAAAIQGGYLPSWSATTPVIVRFTSGTGNWGTGAATNVNAGSIKFTLITEQVK